MVRITIRREAPGKRRFCGNRDSFVVTTPGGQIRVCSQANAIRIAEANRRLRDRRRSR